jgi:hypothetical protein
MNYLGQAVQSVGTLTVGATGGSDTENIYPVKSRAPFGSLSIGVVPQEDNTAYTVTVYHMGEVVETHTYSGTGNNICYMTYPNMIFPANTGTNTIPCFYDPDRFDAEGISIRVEIQNASSTQRVFIVYAVFLEYEGARFAKAEQEE